MVGEWVSYDDAARRIVDRLRAEGKTPPGFWYRFHTRDPRSAKLLQMALELEIDGTHIQFIRAVERVLTERDAGSDDNPLSINGDGVQSRRFAEIWDSSLRLPVFYS